jgi:poly(A) polymerase
MQITDQAFRLHFFPSVLVNSGRMFNHQENNNERHSPMPESIEPVIIQGKNHSISTKDIDQEALKVLYRLRDAGYSGYLVGGGVRDLYMGKRPKDFDISTDARPGQLRKLFRNSRTIGRRFRLVQVYFRGGKIIEVSTLRSQSEYDVTGKEKVLPSNNTFGTLGEDAFRRDLTVNALFFEIEHNTIIDYVGGVQDLDDGIIRIVGEPERRVTRDPVRMMRAIRHAARMDFRIEENTWKAIAENRDKLNLCPSSRVRDELLKDLTGGASEPWARIALKSGLFFTLFPFYKGVVFQPPERGSGDELLSLLRVVDRLCNSSTEDVPVELPDHFLLAVLLVPWAEKHFDLSNQRLKGPAHYKLSRRIRIDLDKVLGERYTLKRMAKEAMTTLLINLATFEQFGTKENWPKWLRNKSYFADCHRFSRVISEAKGGSMVDVDLFRMSRETGRRDIVRQRGNGYKKNSSGGRKGARPSFGESKKGVFGLRGR